MDANRFDRLTLLFGSPGANRRALLKGLVGAALGGVAGARLGAETDAAGTPHVLTLPFPSDPAMKIQQGWTSVKESAHHAIDYIKGDYNDASTWLQFPVLAAFDGDACVNCAGGPAGSTQVFIKHRANSQTFWTLYGHLSSVADGIPSGSQQHTKRVKRGDQIGVSGDTGAPGLTHLHFQVDGPGKLVFDPYDIKPQPPLIDTGAETGAQYPSLVGDDGIRCGPNNYWSANPPIYFSVPITKPKIVSGPTAAPTGDSAVISWTTDQPSNGTVEYGTRGTLGSHVSEPSPSLSTTHQLTITGLKPNTRYYFRVDCANSAGTATSAIKNFKTSLCPTGSTYCIARFACIPNCPSGQHLDPNLCACLCDSGLTLCGDACVDLSRDNDHCHDCGTPCAVLDGERCCPDGCHLLDSDPKNCGGCGVDSNVHICAEGQICQQGSCVVPQNTCDGVGSCGTAATCGASGQCICYQTTEGASFCHLGQSCGASFTCASSADCTDPAYPVCSTVTCCGYGVCIQPCDAPVAAASIDDGPTTTSRPAPPAASPVASS